MHKSIPPDVISDARQGLKQVVANDKTAPFGAVQEQENMELVPKVGLEPTRDILPPVFETGASTIPPLRLGDFSIARLRLSPVGV